uniref:C2H2-type domain-containing protein n=1 Tax=Anopheles gambiae TaxID=7165 RepID=A0ABK8G7N2_ANOGA
MVTSRSSPPHEAQHIDPSPSGQQPPAANVRRTNGRGRRVRIARRYLRSENASTDVWATEVTFRDCKNIPGPQFQISRSHQCHTMYGRLVTLHHEGQSHLGDGMLSKR